MRYDDTNVLNERVSATVLQIFLIWTPEHILEHVIEFQRWAQNCHDFWDGVFWIINTTQTN